MTIEASVQPPGLLSRVAVTGVAGLPALELELGPTTALVGPMGSGKSQLLSAIAWLVTGRPRLAAASDPSLSVSGELCRDGRTTLIARRPGTGLRADRAAAEMLPSCSFLRARDRFGVAGSSAGRVARRFSSVARHVVSDAAAAEALIPIVEKYCEDCLHGELLLIEEPELLLTPQAQRYLARMLREFAENGNQVLYSTRSPAFVDAAHHDEIVRLDLQSGRRTVRRTSPGTLTDRERVRLAAEFDHERSEMFFARAVVLVEGQTERLSLPFVFRALGHDPDADGISIVEVGGKSNLPLAGRLLRQLEIPFVVLFDADRDHASALLEQAIREAAGTAPTIRLSPDFEAIAGIASRDDKVLHAWERFGHGTAGDIPPPLASVVHEAVGLPGVPRRRLAPMSSSPRGPRSSVPDGAVR